MGIAVGMQFLTIFDRWNQQVDTPEALYTFAAADKKKLRKSIQALVRNAFMCGASTLPA